jgi:hypothetical protein
MSAVLIVLALYLGCASVILWLGLFHPRRPSVLFRDAATAVRAGLATAGSAFVLMQIGL